MTITQMRYYAMVCEKKSFSKAAQQLGVSQPAVSFAVKELEEESQVALVRRSKSGVSLTDEGEVLYRSILPILAKIDKLSLTMKDLQLERRFVRVGFTIMMGNYAYSRILAKFKAIYPDIQVVGYEKNTGELLEMLDDGQLDIVLNTRVGLDPEVYNVVDVEKTCMVFCVHKDHPLAGKKMVTWEEMGTQPIILLGPKFGLGARIEKNFAERNIKPNIIHRTEQSFTIERFIENGAAAGFLPELAVRGSVNIVGLRFESEDLSEKYLRAIWLKNTYQFDAVTKYIEVVKEYARERAAEEAAQA